MRVNLPLSGREVSVGENANILSTTDPRGRITYVNPDFVEISGYSESELLGEQHKISEMSARIAAAMEQQSAVSEEINQRIVSIRGRSDQHLGIGRQSQHSASNMALLADRMQQLVKQFWSVRRA
ncbi:aerotaxis receptor Aer-2 [Stutzerimonas stutzeri]|nr:aerotaxis receptor Aer-2 [Stutzerimonas stutzeri]